MVALRGEVASHHLIAPPRFTVQALTVQPPFNLSSICGEKEGWLGCGHARELFKATLVGQAKFRQYRLTFSSSVRPWCGMKMNSGISVQASMASKL